MKVMKAPKNYMSKQTKNELFKQIFIQEIHKKSQPLEQISQSGTNW